MDLIPTIIQDAVSGDILTLAWSNEESLQLTRETNCVWLWSRSRQALWEKGHTSGNYQEIKSIHFDCDNDAIIFQVYPHGPACHRNTVSCWNKGFGGILSKLGCMINDRTSTSIGFTGKLLSDRNLRIKKIGEEAAEFIQALLTNENIENEAADLIYMIMVNCKACNVSFYDVLRKLEKRNTHHE